MQMRAPSALVRRHVPSTTLPPFTTSAPVTRVAASIPPVISDATSVDTPDWQCVRWHESGDNYSDWAGAYGILDGTWAEFMGLSPPAGHYAPYLQDEAALRIYNWSLRANGDGWLPWATRYVCGL